MPKSLPDALDLPKPELLEAKGAQAVESLQLLEGATVRFCFKEMLSTDSITLRWESTHGDYAPIASQDGVEGGCVEFHVPKFYVGLRLDNFALFSCVLTRDGEEHPSPVADVFIKLPPLPQPRILQASGGVLDLSSLCGEDPVIYVEPWAFIDPVQRVQLIVTGEHPDGSKARFVPFEDLPVTTEEVSDGWRRTLSRAELVTLKEGSELYITFWVEFLPRVTRPVYRLFPGLVLTLRTEPHLELVAPTVPEATLITPEETVLNPDNAKDGATIQVHYEHMCPCDWVCAYWEGTPGNGSPQLECKRADSRELVEFRVGVSAITANFREEVMVSYSVLREGQTWASPPRKLQVEGPRNLPAPVVKEATRDILALSTFSGGAECTVVPWIGIELEQPCWLWVTGEREDGSAYRFQVLDGEPVSAEWLDSGIKTLLPREELKKLADCSGFIVHFAVSFNGIRDLTSAERFPVLELEISQEALVLNEPQVREAVGEDLTIWNGRDGVTVRVEFAGISPHQMIRLDWIRPNGTRLVLEPQPGNTDPGYVDFSIPRDAVIEGAGRTIPVSYTVSSTCKLAPSRGLNLRISRPVDLPAPVVREATPPATNGGILDLRNFAGDGHVSVEKWWFMLVGQNAWMECIGTRENGSRHVIEVMSWEALTESDLANGVSRVIKREKLEELRNRTPLEVVFRSTTVVGANMGGATEFPLLQLEFRKPLKDITDFDPAKNGWDNWQKGAGAASSGDLVVKAGAVPGAASGYYLFDWGNTYTSNPVTQREKLFKLYTQLESGRVYRFSAWVRDNSGSPPKPQMVLVANGVNITPITLPGVTWQLLQGTFTATSTTRLSVDNLQMGNMGNDFDVTLITVEEV